MLTASSKPCAESCAASGQNRGDVAGSDGPRRSTANIGSIVSSFPQHRTDMMPEGTFDSLRQPLRNCLPDLEGDFEAWRGARSRRATHVYRSSRLTWQSRMRIPTSPFRRYTRVLQPVVQTPQGIKWTTDNESAGEVLHRRLLHEELEMD